MADERKIFSKRHWYGLLFLMIVLGIFAIGQQMKGEAETEPEETPQQVNNLHPEFATMFDNNGVMGEVLQGSVSGWFNGQYVNRMPVEYVLVDGYAMYQGDILINPDGPMTAGLGVKRENLLWDGLVAYEIASNLPDQHRIHDAIAHWEEMTSIRFVERTNSNSSQYRNYIRFQPGNGCSSYVGMQGGGQPINLARGCSTGNTIHEIGHALGLWHEHSRSDRDDFVEIRYENIVSLYAFNFDKQIANGVDIGEYDYGSIMHYPAWAFSKNGKDTIVPLQPDAEIGQRDTLSEGDITAIEAMYGN